MTLRGVGVSGAKVGAEEQAEGMGTLTEERTQLRHVGGWMETTRGMPLSSPPRAVYSFLGIL